MSWNSSTMISAKRSAQRSRRPASPASRSRTRSSRSSKSTPARSLLGRRVGGAEAVEQVVEQRQRGPRVVVGAGRAVRRPALAVGGAVVVLERLGADRQLRGVQRARQRASAPRGGQAACRRRAPRSAGRHARAGRCAASAAPAAAAAAASAAGSGAGPAAGPSAAACVAPRLRSARVGVGDHRLQLAPVGGGEVDGAAPPRAAIQASSAVSNAAAASRRAAASSSTTKRGSRPAASGWARSTRAQKPWIVPIQAASTARACSPSPSSVNRRRMRSRSSAAAFSVNVSVRIAPTRDAVVQDRLGEALDHDRGLARARARGQQRGLRAVGDRGALLRRAPHAGSSTVGSPARQMPG